MNIATLTKSSIILFSSVLLLSACGGSDSDPTPATTLTGVFIDAPVQGLGYQTANHQGITNEKGEFTYQADETVSFFFNGIDLGSAPAQAKFPVTLLPNSPKLAQIFQTLDHNADTAKIDVSGITLGSALKAQLGNVISNKAGTPKLENILTEAKLTELQTSNNVTLVNQTLVDETTAADHLLDNIDPIAITASDFANKLFLDSDGGGIGSDMAVITFKESGSGEFLGQDGSNTDDAFVEPFNWSTNDDGTLSITFLNDDAGDTAVGIKLSESANLSTIHVSEDDGDDFIRQWYSALPLSVARLDGKHFSMDMSDDDDCTARTVSYTGVTAVINEQCTGGFFTSTAQVSMHSTFDNVLTLLISDNDGVYPFNMALVDGSIADGKYAWFDYNDNSELRGIGTLKWTETNASLAAQ